MFNFSGTYIHLKVILKELPPVSCLGLYGQVNIGDPPCAVQWHLSTAVCDLDPEPEDTKHYHLH